MNLIKKLESIDSTNRYAIEELDLKETKEFGIVWAISQFAGRGLQENTWESESGKNLTFSIVFFPHFLHPSQQFVITQLLSLAITDYLRQYVSSNIVKIKWPNDIYVGLHKICGMLIHNKIVGNNFFASIAGVGININQDTFLGSAPNPISLKNITGNSYDLESELESLSKYIENRFNLVKENGVEIFIEEYCKTLLYYKQNTKYVYEGKEIEASIEGVNEYGHLELLTSYNKKIVCNMKEIVFKHQIPKIS